MKILYLGVRVLLADDFVDDWDLFLAPYQQAVE